MSDKTGYKQNSVISKTWFCVFNNPKEYGYEGNPKEVCEMIIQHWIADYPARSAAASYCVSEKGLHHVHMVLESPTAMRFKAVKKEFPKAHITVTKGNRKDVIDYINKTGRFEDTNEEVLYSSRTGEISGRDKNKGTFETLDEYIQMGLTPKEILKIDPKFYLQDKYIRKMFMNKRYEETPEVREVKTTYHVGKSGSGKSYYSILLKKEHGDENVYIVSDYKFGFDLYEGEPIIFLDEFKGQANFYDFLMWLDVYKHQVKCRYANSYMLWNEVHIASIIPLEELYGKLNNFYEEREEQVYKQVARRITTVCIHKELDGFYIAVSFPMELYRGYYLFEQYVEKAIGICILKHEGYAQDKIVNMPICDLFTFQNRDFTYVLDAVERELARVGYFDSTEDNPSSENAEEGDKSERSRPATIDRILNENTHKNNTENCKNIQLAVEEVFPPRNEKRRDK